MGKLLLVGFALTVFCLAATAGPCLTVTANDIAADDGCTLSSPSGNYFIATFSDFTFTLGTVTAPGGFSAIDNIISLSFGFFGLYPGFEVTDTGDSLWGISSGEWSFTLGYSFTSYPSITNFAALEGGASASGTGGSSITETVSGIGSTATTSQPDPPWVAPPCPPCYLGGTVTDVVSNNAGSGSSNLMSVSNIFETPEPSTPMLVALGLLALGLIGYRRRSRSSKSEI
ncbi:MAG TPA: PEP-CTERM sorting domain-containing protein [Bryobacteraceae bacterium]